MIIKGHDSGWTRLGLIIAYRRDENELRRHQHRLHHQAHRLTEVAAMFFPQVESTQQHVEFRRAHRPTIGPARKIMGDFLRGSAFVDAGAGLGSEGALFRLGRRLASFGEHLVEHAVGHQQVLLHEQRRERIAVAGAEHLVWQDRRRTRIDSKQVAQGVAVLDLAQAADDELPRVLRAQVFHPRDPVAEHRALGGRRLFFLFLWRHVLRLHARRGVVPQLTERRGARVLDGVTVGELTFRLLLTMAVAAVGLEERFDLLGENLLGLRLRGRHTWGSVAGLERQRTRQTRQKGPDQYAQNREWT